MITTPILTNLQYKADRFVRVLQQVYLVPQNPGFNDQYYVYTIKNVNNFQLNPYIYYQTLGRWTISFQVNPPCTRWKI